MWVVEGGIVIDLRLASVEEVIAEVRGATLIVADPPWQYEQATVHGNAAQHYDLSTQATIVAALAASYQSAAPDARLVVWTTWPQIGEFAGLCSGDAWPWGSILTGGCWFKNDRPGAGFHWRGDTEPVVMFRRGSPHIAREAMLSNGHASPRSSHSEKPAGWMRGWLRRWTNPGDLVLDLYAGRAPLAHACAAEGRNYIGAEMDPERHGEAMAGLMSSGLIRSAPTMKQQGMFGVVR